MVHGLQITKSEKASTRALVTSTLEKIPSKDLLIQSNSGETFHLERDLQPPHNGMPPNRMVRNQII